MRTNTAIKRQPIVTHEGGRAAHIRPVQQLRRSVLACLLYEDGFYEDGQAIADRIREEAQNVSPAVLAELALEARSHFNLRHVPLYLTALLAQRARGTSLVSETIRDVIQRADELSEFLAIYAKVNGVTPDKIKPKLSNQVRKGLAMAFGKFSEYSLAKYSRDGAVKLRDTMFLAHPKPKDAEQAALWQRLIDGKLATPDTWEVIISGAPAAGLSKKEAWEKVVDLWVSDDMRISNHMAILRNLRNLIEADVSDVHLAKIRNALTSDAWSSGARRILPFRYVAAARAAPSFEPALDVALCRAIAALPELPDRTVVLVDVSGSMNQRLSSKSDMSRMDAAATLASMINAEQLRVFTFSDGLVEVAPRRGMAGVDAIHNSQHHSSTRLFEAVASINQNVPHDRLIVITDEQATGGISWGFRILGGSLTSMPDPVCENAYMINVASNQNGVGYGKWTHIDGFSEQVLRWIVEYEGAE